MTGNHEFYAGYDETVRELANLGFMFLENDGAAVGEDLYLAGVPDTFAGAAYGKTPDLNRAFAKAGKGLSACWCRIRRRILPGAISTWKFPGTRTAVRFSRSIFLPSCITNI